jgi:hypothetical protein
MEGYRDGLYGTKNLSPHPRGDGKQQLDDYLHRRMKINYNKFDIESDFGSNAEIIDKWKQKLNNKEI